MRRGRLYVRLSISLRTRAIGMLEVGRRKKFSEFNWSEVSNLASEQKSKRNRWKVTVFSAAGVIHFNVGVGGCVCVLNGEQTWSRTRDSGCRRWVGWFESRGHRSASNGTRLMIPNEVKGAVEALTDVASGELKKRRLW